MAVPLHAAADHPAVEHVQGGGEGGRAIAFVVVGHGRGLAPLHRQPRLGAVEGLDLALLVDREHDRVRRRVHVEADHVAQLGDELGILGQLEGPHPVRDEPVRLPDPLHRAQADPGRLRHGPSGPARGLARRPSTGQLDHALDDCLWQGWRAGRAGLVAQQPVHPFSREALPPASDAGLGLAGPAHDGVRAQPFGRGQNDPRPPDVLLGAVAIGRDRLQAGAVGGRDLDGGSFAHPAEVVSRRPDGNHPSQSVH